MPPAVAYPKRSETDSRKKTPKWIKQMAQAYVSEYHRTKNGMWYDGRNTYKKLLEYALGKQDTTQYLRYNDDQGRFGTSFSDPMALAGVVDQKPLPVLPIKLRALEAMLTEKEYDPTVNVLGAQAEAELTAMLNELQIWMQQGQALKQMGMQPPTNLPQDIPQDEDDLREFLENYQLDAEIAMEEKMAVCYEESNMRQLAIAIRQELIRYGLCCLHDSQLPGQRPLIKHIPPGRGLFLPSAKLDCSDWWAGAHIDTVTVETIRREVAAGGGTLTEDEWRSIEGAASNSMAGMSDPIDPELGRAVDSAAIQVVRVFFLSDDEEVQHTKLSSAGNPKTYTKHAGFKNESGKGNVTRAMISNVYEATLVLGTDVAYNCRLAVEQKRDPQNPLKGRLPYAAYVAGQLDGKAVSVVDYCISIINDMERSIRMWRTEMKTYTPEGANFDPDALASIPFKGPDGKALSALDAYEFYKRTGDSFGKRVDDGNILGPVVVKNPGGVPATAQHHWADFWNSMQLLEVVTGANAVASAATPTADMGKAVANMALQGTQNVLRYLFDAQEAVHLAISKNLAARIWATEHRNPVTGSMRNPGTGEVREVKAFPGLHKYQFFTGIEARPTPEEWQELYEVAKTAWQSGLTGSPDGLDYEDYLAIRRIPNLKRAAREVGRRIKRRRKRMMEENAANSQNNAQQQSASIQEKKAADMETMQMANQLKMGELQFQRETQWGGIDRQIEGQQYVAELTNQTKAAIAADQQEGTIARDMVQQQHEMRQTDVEAQHRASEIELAADVAPKPTKAAA